MPAVAYRRFETLEAMHNPAPASGHLEPIVIDFSKRRKKPSSFHSYLPWVLLMAVGFLILGLAAFVIYGEKTGFLKLHFLKPDAPRAQPVAFAVPDDLSLPRIPREMLEPQTVSLVPILKRLPVGRKMETPPRIKRGATVASTKANDQDFTPAFVPEPAPRVVKPKEITVAVEQDETQARIADLTDAAANDAAAGRSENAIRLYNEALALDPEDSDTAYNLAALLLQKASFFDTRGLWDDALRTYHDALRIWAADDDMGRSIRARLEWVQTKQNQTASVMEQENLPDPPSE